MSALQTLNELRARVHLRTRVLPNIIDAAKRMMTLGASVEEVNELLDAFGYEGMKVKLTAEDQRDTYALSATFMGYTEVKLFEVVTVDDEAA
ncbi:hypothetical protein [Achromobacter phage Motura]|uniref:Uncharacterized protein n=1 Tax=Achromobacter phage Motura TaxID=2591403 RepID=A0A514CT81_9CAUD|nr:hypothetical protein H1O15_gp272 [Achromobacter phage Motura]QDH83689.1 hypothetical protein [Achromobacter phage Motura]